MSATLHHLGESREPSLDPLVQLVAADMNAVNAVILDRMQSEVALIPELAGHLISGGGKRMRPMLTLASAALCEYPGGRHHLFSRAFELMVEDGSLKVLKILSHASAVIAEGEVDQLTAQRRIDTDEDHYLAIIAAKTAALFAAACKIAPVVAEAGEKAEMALDSFGRNLGIAFQLVDDAIDYSSDAATMGKGQGDDFRDGKMTLPVILAHARGSDSERKFWAAAMAGERASDDDLAEAIRLVGSSGALADTMERARLYARRAIDAIAPFPAGRAKAAMVEAAQFAVARAY